MTFQLQKRYQLHGTFHAVIALLSLLPLQQEYNKVQRSMQKPGRQAAQEQQQAGI